ncbi:MAG: hypothetical protein ACTSQO_03770 [Candidatus Helarchaeota archaeon]
MNSDKRMRIMEKISKLPKGVNSASGKYWCLTCKKLFVLEQARCPYMTKMCVNTPIAIETSPPDSVAGLERFGLYYPKIAQKLMNTSVIEALKGEKPSYKSDNSVNNSLSINNEWTRKLREIGEKIAVEYFKFLDDWKINYKKNELQVIKSLILILSGCETAQRNTEDGFIFLIMDIEKVWKKEIFIEVIKSAVEVLSEKLAVKEKINKEVKVDTIDLFMHLEVGKYFCSMCSMFFEYGPKKEKVTCPLMPQKCMFMPTDIKQMNYSIEMLDKLYKITPDIYKRLFLFPKLREPKKALLKILEEDWGFKIDLQDRYLESTGRSIGII